MTIEIVKLSTDEDLICDVKETTAEHLVVKNPVVIMIQQTERGVGVALAPFMPYVVGDITIPRSAIVATGLPEEQLQQEYTTRFGSGIVLSRSLPPNPM
jgi:hypothetical protein